MIRQAESSDLDAIVHVCQAHAEYWLPEMPEETELDRFFTRALSHQDEVFQFWVAENGFKEVVGWEMLSAFSADPARRRLTAEATTCLWQPTSSLGRMLATHAVRHALRTPLQYVFAQVPTQDSLMVDVLEGVGYQEVGLIPAVNKPPPQPERLEFVYIVEH